MSNVTPIREADALPLWDVPAMLRRLAKHIEEGEYGEVHSAAVVLEAPGMPVLGFGRGDPVNASELFACAHQKLVLARLRDADGIEL
jgi:hypothetical protein